MVWIGVRLPWSWCVFLGPSKGPWWANWSGRGNVGRWVDGGRCGQPWGRDHGSGEVWGRGRWKVMWGGRPDPGNVEWAKG